MKEQTSRKTIFIQRLILVMSLIITLEFLDKTDSHIQFSLTQNLHLNMTRENLISLGLYFTTFGVLTPLAFLAINKETETPQ
jgi:hypothetical protein